MMKKTIYNGKYFQLDADITVTKMVGQGTIHQKRKSNCY